MKISLLPLFIALSIVSSLSGQIRLDVQGNARVTGDLIELIKPSDPGHILNLSSSGAAMDINATTDLYINSGRNINLDADNPLGKVGIGTSNPQVKFHIVGDRLRLSTPGNDNRYLDFRTDGSLLDISPVGAHLLIDPGANNLILATQSGQVGIGTDAPTAKLSVVGNAKVEGNFELFKAPGDSSLFIGPNAGLNDQGFDNRNTFIGNNAGKFNTGGDHNTYLGYDAGMSNIAGYDNVFIGHHAARNSGVISSRNVFVGDSTGVFNESHENIFIGTRAGKLNIDGYGNTFLGFTAGTENTTGYSNTFLGRFGGVSNTEGFYNVFVGASAGNNNTLGDSNSFVGLSAGYSNTSGSSNTFLGRSAGAYNVSGTRNTYIGNSSGTLLDSLDRAIAIGYSARVDCHNCAVLGGTGEHAVSVGIGTAAPEKTLDLHGEAIIRDENKLSTFQSSGSNSFISFENNGGTAGADLGYFNDTNDAYFFINTPGGNFGELTINGANVGLGLLDPSYQLQLSTNSAAKPNSSTWTVASDKRLKKDVKPFTDGLEILQKIEPVWYRYNGKAGLSSEEKSIGIIAQEMQRIAPYTIGEFEHKKNSKFEKYLSFDANALFYITINAVKEQQELIEGQKDEIESLRGEIQELKNLMEQMLVERKETRGGNYILPLKQEALLEQNHPNPFHQNTVIKYFIPGQVNTAYIQVTSVDGNVLGKVDIQESGAGQLTIKVQTYPAGTYYYSLVLDGEISETKRMILTR